MVSCITVELSRMKTLVGEKYLKGTDLDQIRTTLDLLQKLEDKRIIGWDYTAALLPICEDIGRTDLVLAVEQFRGIIHCLHH